MSITPIICPLQMQPDAMLVGFVLAFRWVIVDQRRRCPVCLCWVSNPVKIGQPSHTIFDWYGTEFMCSKGHGLLHVAENPTSSFSAQRWLALDESWRSLF